VVDDWLADSLPDPARRVIVILLALLASYLLARAVEQRLCPAVYRFLAALPARPSSRASRGEPAKAPARR
jgi:hypothetical protein